MFNFWWLATLVNRLEPCLPALSSQKNEMLVFRLCSTSDDQPGCSMDSTPSATPLQPKKLNACFWIMFNFWWSAGLVNGLKPHLPPLSSQKNKMLVFGLCSTFDDQPGWSVDSYPPLPPLSSQKNKILVFGLCSTSDDWPCWSIDLNPVCLPSPVKKMKCLFLDYV